MTARYAFLHAADLRLDAPFTGVGRTPAPLAAVLRDASVQAWDALVAAAVARRVAAVLVSGGLCDGLERGARAQVRLRDGVARLREHDIAVFLALGARDPQDGFAAITDWPEGAVVFTPGHAGAVPLRRDGAYLGTVHGVGIGRDDSAEAAARRLYRGDLGGPHIALLPSTVGRGGVALDVLRDAGIDYWALGGGAEFAVQHARDPWLVSAGTPQARTPHDVGAHGAALVEVEDGVITRVTLEPLDRVRAAVVRIDEADDAAALQQRLRDAAAGLRAAHPEHALLLTALLGPRAGVARVARHPDARAALLAEARRECERSDPLLWWAALRTAPPAPLPAAADDLPGEVARRRALLAGDAERTLRFIEQRFEPLRETWSATLDPRDVDPLLDDAAAVATDALVLGDAGHGGR
jgi:DNA repair exonuclease SbcCD nuclease subunit